MLFLAALLQVAHADSLTCDAVSGPKLRYEEWSKSGGAAPGPDTVTRTLGWTLDGVSLYTRSETYLSGVPAATGDLDWQWDLASRKGKGPSNQGFAPEVTTTYTADVTVWTRSGRPLSGDASRLTLTMACTQVRQYGVP